MLSDSEFLNRVTAASFNAPSKRAIHSRFVYDGASAKQIYNITDGFESNVTPGSRLAGREPSNKYDVAPAKHTPSPEYHLFGSVGHRPSAAPRTTRRPAANFLGMLYGLPPSRNIKLFSDQPGSMGLAHSKTPEADIVTHNWQTREARVDTFGARLTEPGAFNTFMADPRMQKFVRGAPAAKIAGAVGIANSRPAVRAARAAKAAAPPAAAPIVAGLAFSAATPTATSTATPTVAPTAPPDADEIPPPGPTATPPSPPVKGPAPDIVEKKDVEVKEKKPFDYDFDAVEPSRVVLQQDFIDYKKEEIKDTKVLAALVIRMEKLYKFAKKRSTATTVKGCISALNTLKEKIKTDSNLKGDYDLKIKIKPEYDLKSPLTQPRASSAPRSRAKPTPKAAPNQPPEPSASEIYS